MHLETKRGHRFRIRSGTCASLSMFPYLQVHPHRMMVLTYLKEPIEVYYHHLQLLQVLHLGAYQWDCIYEEESDIPLGANLTTLTA